jgi:hypothetical protein
LGIFVAQRRPGASV